LLRTLKILASSLCLLGLSALPVHGNDWYVEDAGKIVAVSDVHGAYDAMVATLRNTGVLDAELAWSGGTSRLVIVGDLLDRGPRSRDAMDLLMRLEDEAKAAGGYVHILIGNHEAMNLLGDLRYVSKEEYAAFAEDEASEHRDRWFRAWLRRQPMPRDNIALRERFDETFPPGFFALREAFGTEGKYGSWLLTKASVAVINKTAFVHGGLSPVITEYGLDGLNTALQKQLAAYVSAMETLFEAEILLQTDTYYEYPDILANYMPSLDDSPEVLAALESIKRLDEESLFATDGPLWYRAHVGCSPIIEAHRLDAVLAAIGADRVVIGHTPTPTRTVLQRFGGRLIEVDTGMLNFYYRGSGNALVLSGNETLVYNQVGSDPYAPTQHPRNVGVRPHHMSADELASLLANGRVSSKTKDPETGRTIVEISDDDHVVSAIYNKRRSRGFFPDVAAYRLDRLLGLDMVPVTVRREVDGKDGSVQFFPPRTMNEENRAATGRGRGATCPLGDQLMAMYVFDVLVYNEGRTTSRILYDTRDWGLMLIEHGRAFTQKKGRPRHLANAPLEISDGWRAALESLDAAMLRERFSDVLDKRQIDSLATRRDELLAEKAAKDRRNN
jgi:hypothetical protein